MHQDLKSDIGAVSSKITSIRDDIHRIDRRITSENVELIKRLQSQTIETKKQFEALLSSLTRQQDGHMSALNVKMTSIQSHLVHSTEDQCNRLLKAFSERSQALTIGGKQRARHAINRSMLQSIITIICCFTLVATLLADKTTVQVGLSFITIWPDIVFALVGLLTILLLVLIIAVPLAAWYWKQEIRSPKQ